MKSYFGETRNLIVQTKIEAKKQKAYELLINLIEEYNIKLLSTKIYWENQKDREEYKKFWEEYKKIDKSSQEGQVQKQILFVKNELKKLEENKENENIIKFYKDKLVEYGVLRILKNSCKTEGKFIKRAVRV